MKLSFKRFLYAVSILLMACVCYRIFFALQHNSKIKTEFRLSSSFTGGTDHYQANTPMEELGDSDFHFPGLNVAAASSVRAFRLRSDLHYYDTPNRFSKPSLTLKAGTVCVMDGYSLGQGPYSCPTYTQGWRYTTPLLPLHSERYYIPLSELERLYSDYYWDAYWSCRRTGKGQFSQMNLLEAIKNSPSNREVLACDTYLYGMGYYLSPDLLLPLWDGWDTVLVLLSSLCIIPGITPPTFPRKHSKGSIS